MLTSHVMDLQQVLEQAPGCTVLEGDASDVGDSDVVVLLSATPLTVGTSRLEYLEKNAAIADALADRLAPGWSGVLVVVTNPVDPLVTRLQARTGFDRRRIVGYTVNDSLRLRTGLARVLGTPPGSVEAWVLGEHGDTSVPLFDRVSVDGVRVHPTAEQAAAAEEYLRTFYVRHVALDSGRSSTWTSGLGVARMVSALDGDGRAVARLGGPRRGVRPRGRRGHGAGDDRALGRRADPRVGAQPGSARGTARLGRARPRSYGEDRGSLRASLRGEASCDEGSARSSAASRRPAAGDRPPSRQQSANFASRSASESGNRESP